MKFKALSFLEKVFVVILWIVAISGALFGIVLTIKQIQFFF